MSAMDELNVSLQHSILTLAANGWSQRRIARELAIHRETVGRHLRLAASKPAKVPAGSDGEAEAKPAKVPAGIFPHSRSQCEPWREFIEKGCQAGLSAQRLYQDLLADHQLRGVMMR
jgi:IS30 family transposase